MTHSMSFSLSHIYPKMEDHNSWQTQLEVKIEKMKKKPSKPRKQEQK